MTLFPHGRETRTTVRACHDFWPDGLVCPVRIIHISGIDDTVRKHIMRMEWIKAGTNRKDCGFKLTSAMTMLLTEQTRRSRSQATDLIRKSMPRKPFRDATRFEARAETSSTRCTAKLDKVYQHLVVCHTMQ